MKVLHIYSGNLYGGVETMLVTLARAQPLVPGLEHEFALTFRGRLSEELVANGAVVHDLGAARARRPHTILRARKALRQVLRDGAFDVAICHAAWPYALFAKTVKRAGLPLVFWAHDALTGRHWTERWARRIVPDLVLANSQYTAASGSTLWPNALRRVIYCPVEDSPDRPDAAARAAIRVELSTPADAVVIIQASRLESWKGHESLLSALGKLRDQPDWHCWIAGGPQRPHEVEYFERLQAQARSLSIQDRVHFLGQRADVDRLLTAADIYCQPNLTPEPFGIALVEALYAGLPVVTSALGGALEIVDETCGILAPAGDVTALTAALDSLMTDPERRAALGHNGPARALEISDPAQQTRRLQEALAEALMN